MVLETKNQQILAVVLAIVIVSSIGGYIYYSSSKSESKPAFVPRSVEDGDTVKLDYTGHLTTRDGPVFETTLQSVAEDGNVTKSATFAAPGVYQPITLVAGGSTPNKGIAAALIGQEENATVWLSVPASDGYGPHHDELVVTVPAVDELPLYETMPRSGFMALFGIDDAHLLAGTTDGHPFWGWEITILNVDADSVDFENTGAAGSIGGSVGLFPWTATVTGISNNTIYIQNSVEDGKVGALTVDSEVLGKYDPDMRTGLSNSWTELGVSGSLGKGVVTNNRGGLTIDFNLETAGATLWYEVTIIQVT